MKNGLRRHSRFFFAIVFGGVAAGLASLLFTTWQMLALLGVNSFFLMYLCLSAHLGLTTTAQDLRQQAAADDEGIVLIVLLAVGAVVVSLGVIVWVLNGQDTKFWQAALALSAVPLGWGTLHTVLAFRYAHMFYSAKTADALMFPGTKDPDLWDFYYVSFGIGMTAQVSDVIVGDQGVRKMVLLHAIGSFFYNTVILALAVNAGLALGNP